MVELYEKLGLFYVGQDIDRDSMEPTGDLTLLKNTGDWVAPGDVIATIGDSGGQPQASLYFELRRGTKPENPRRWVTKRPGS